MAIYMTHMDDFIARARIIMSRTGHQYIRTEHLFFALFELPFDEQPVQIQHIPRAAVEESITAIRRPTCAAEVTGELSASAKRTIAKAIVYAGRDDLTNEHLLEGIVATSPKIRQILNALQTDN